MPQWKIRWVFRHRTSRRTRTPRLPLPTSETTLRRHQASWPPWRPPAPPSSPRPPPSVPPGPIDPSRWARGPPGPRARPVTSLSSPEWNTFLTIERTLPRLRYAFSLDAAAAVSCLTACVPARQRTTTVLSARLLSAPTASPDLPTTLSTLNLSISYHRYHARTLLRVLFISTGNILSFNVYAYLFHVTILRTV